MNEELTLKETLRNKITAGTIPFGQYLPGQRAICSEYHCSASTAQKALKELEAEGLVISKPRKGYLVTSKAIFKNQKGVIAIIAQKRVDLGVWKKKRDNLLLAIQEKAFHMGKSILVVPEEEMLSKKTEAVINEMNIQGVLTESIDARLMEDFMDLGVPVVAMDSYNESHNGLIDEVYHDQTEGGMLAAKYFIEQGHKDFAWVGETFESYSSRMRYMGALCEIKRNHLDISMHVPQLSDINQMRDSLELFLKKKNRPKAVFALWFSAALLLAQTAQGLGLQLGEDIVIAGWGEESEVTSYDLLVKDFCKHSPVISWSSKHVASVILNRLNERFENLKNLPTKILVPVQINKPF